jgi:hypothetical protein
MGLTTWRTCLARAAPAMLSDTHGPMFHWYLPATRPVPCDGKARSTEARSARGPYKRLLNGTLIVAPPCGHRCAPAAMMPAPPWRAEVKYTDESSAVCRRVPPTQLSGRSKPSCRAARGARVAPSAGCAHASKNNKARAAVARSVLPSIHRQRVVGPLAVKMAVCRAQLIESH